MNSKIIIEGDKEVSIVSINQWHTYGGLLEGVPTDRMNERIMNRAKEIAKKDYYMEEVYLIEPVQTPIEWEGTYRGGTPAELPGVVCVAEVRYLSACRDTTKDFSALALIWFQNEFAFPIDETVLEKIKAIPFSEICGEFCY